MTPGDGRRRANEKESRGRENAWAEGEGAASYARKQEDATLKNPARGKKCIGKGEWRGVYVSPTPTREGCPTIARHMAPFFSRRVCLRFPTRRRYTATRGRTCVDAHACMRMSLCMYVCMHSDARTDASVKLFEFSME